MIQKLLRRLFVPRSREPTAGASEAAAPAHPGQQATLPGEGGPSDELLRGRSALLAGAGPNIGRGIALALARAGADLFLVDRLGPRLTALQQILAPLERRVTTGVADLTAVREVDGLLARLREDAPPDVVVLNVGVNQSAPGPLGFDAMELLFRTNVVGPLYLAARLAEDMVAQGRSGSIVFITSVHQWALGRTPVYSATKAALGMAMREMAMELAPHRIRVNSVAPGWVALDKDGRQRPHQPAPLLGTSVHPSFVGAAVVHLAADALSGNTTGATIAVDGGLSLHSYLTVPRP